jgi:hypothetical protein
MNILPPNHHNQSNFAPNQDNTSTPTTTTTNLSQNIPQLQQQPQLMQQLQQTSLPAPKPPSTPVNNNQTAKVNILPQNTAISATVAAPITTKTELPQISPTGNNNKSNINLNHLTQNNQQQMMQQIPNNPSSQQQSSLMNMNIPSTQGQVVTNMMSSVPQASAALLAQQNASNLNQIKHQAAQFGMNVFNDSLEHTLASLVEQQPINNQKNDMAMLMEFQHQQKMMMSQLSGSGPNGFGDFNGVNGVNNLMNMLAMPNMDPNNLIFNAAQMKSAARSFPDNTWQTNNPMIKPNSSQSNVNPMQLPSSQQLQQQQMQLPPPPPPQQSAAQNNQQQQQQPQQQTMPQPSPKAPKAMLTPKPIEELMNNPNERSKSSMSGSSSFSKSEQNLKNASSWSQLGAGSPQNMGAPNTSIKSKVPSTDTFQEFKNKAKEQSILRQRQEQEKMKKQKEQELKRQQQESLQKQQQKINDDLSNGHK